MNDINTAWVQKAVEWTTRLTKHPADLEQAAPEQAGAADGERCDEHQPCCDARCQGHGLLQILWCLKLDVDADGVGEATREEVGLLRRR